MMTMASNATLNPPIWTHRPCEPHEFTSYPTTPNDILFVGLGAYGSSVMDEATVKKTKALSLVAEGYLTGMATSLWFPWARKQK